MHQDCQMTVKTSELEDQYAIIFGLALWPQETHEIISFKNRRWKWQQCQHWHEMGPGLRWRAHILSERIDNDLIKRFKTLPGPSGAWVGCFWHFLQNWTEIGRTNKSEYFPYYFPNFPRGRRWAQPIELATQRWRCARGNARTAPRKSEVQYSDRGGTRGFQIELIGLRPAPTPWENRENNTGT